MVSADEVRVRLADYVLGEILLDDFEDWFVSHSWNAPQIEDADLQRLVFEIESKLSEYSGGYFDENALRRRLAPLAKQLSVNVTIGNWRPIVSVHTGSSDSMPVLAELRIGFVDIQPSMAFV